MRSGDGKAMWIGAGIAVVATLVLTVAADGLESTVNGPGNRVLAAPVLWGLGGGLGLCLGAGTASWLTDRVGPGVLAAVIALVPFLVLLIVAYNDKSLRFEDQLVGSLIIVVLPGFAAAVVVATAAALAARLFGRRGSPATGNRFAA